MLVWFSNSAWYKLWLVALGDKAATWGFFAPPRTSSLSIAKPARAGEVDAGNRARFAGIENFVPFAAALEVGRAQESR